MDKSKSQQYNFAYEALPTLYHGQTDQFIKFIEKDGLKFLKFWWDHVGESYEAENRISSEGLRLKVIEVGKKNHLIHVTLPVPIHPQDPYLVCMAGSAERRFFLVRLPTTRLFTLELGENFDKKQTQYYEITPRLRKIPMGEASEATPDEFIKMIRKLTKK